MLEAVTHRGVTYDRIGPGDICLIELLHDGRSDAPLEITGELHDLGYVKIEDGKRVLTSKGRRRAEALENSEDHLRASFAPQTKKPGVRGSALKCVPMGGMIHT
jgi:hypothetical protein